MGASCEKGEDRSVVLKETWIILAHLPVGRIQDTQRLSDISDVSSYARVPAGRRIAVRYWSEGASLYYSIAY